MLTLSQKLSQQQKLSPQQIQYQKLLQLNTMALEQRIKTELEINPILEEVLEEEIDMTQDQDKEDKESGEEEIPETDFSKDEFELEDFMNDHDYEVETDRMNRSKDDDIYQPLVSARESISEHLEEQLRMLALEENMFMLGQEIIGSIDDRGYLKRSLEDIVTELEMFEHISIPMPEAEHLLKTIQTFDPTGIAARNLQECLLIQLKNGSYDQYFAFLAEELLVKHFDDFTKRRFESIKQKMQLTDAALKSTIDLIQGLNPKPGEGNIQSIEMNQITPDFLIEKVEDNFIITLNDRSLPSVTISRTYLEMFNTNKRNKKTEREKDTYKFLREKFESAKWFIACIQQRRETLMKIMRLYSRNSMNFLIRDLSSCAR